MFFKEERGERERELENIIINCIGSIFKEEDIRYLKQFHGKDERAGLFDAVTQILEFIYRNIDIQKYIHQLDATQDNHHPDIITDILTKFTTKNVPAIVPSSWNLNTLILQCCTSPEVKRYVKPKPSKPVGLAENSSTEELQAQESRCFIC